MTLGIDPGGSDAALKGKVVIFTPLLSATGGGQHAIAQIASSVRSRGLDVAIVTRPPFDPTHRYVRRLAGHGVRVFVARDILPRRWYRMMRDLGTRLGGPVIGTLRGGGAREGRRTLGGAIDARAERLERRLLFRALSRAAAGPLPVLVDVWGPTGLAPTVLEWGRRRRSPVVYHEMGEADPAYLATWKLEGTVRALPAAHAVVCCSARIAANVAEVYGYRGAVHTIPFPVESPDGAIPPRSTPDRCAFGAIGRLVRHKRHADLLRAIAVLRREGLDATLIVAGDGPERPRLERLASELGIGRSVSFLGEFERLADVMSRFDVFALTSESESQCMPITESMAYGKPVIAARFGGMPDFVEDGVTGWLVDLGDEEQLVSRMRRMTRDPDTRLRMGAAGRGRFQAQFTPETVMAQTAAVYLDLLQGEL